MSSISYRIKVCAFFVIMVIAYGIGYAVGIMYSVVRMTFRSLASRMGMLGAEDQINDKNCRQSELNMYPNRWLN